MAQDFSRDFYNGRRWRKTARAYAESQNWICERCHNRCFVGSGKRPRYIVHHRTPLTVENIHNDAIAYGWDNLELLCIACHNAVHGGGIDRECVFDASGQPVGIQNHIRRTPPGHGG